MRNVWIADPPTFAARQLTRYNADDGQPIASLRITPDGKTVVFARGTEANEAGRIADPTSGITARKQQVLAADVQTGKIKVLGELGCGEEGCEDIQISPDGQSAVWAAKKQLWIAPLSSVNGARQLTELAGENTTPRWSPDGYQIAFVSKRGDHSFIAIADVGGDEVHYLAPTVDRDIMPRWSPDGKRIAFVRLPGIEEKLPLIPERPVPWSIWVADASTGSAQQIWQSGQKPNDSFPELTADTAFYFATNDRLLYASEQDGWNHLYSIAATGGSPTLLTPGHFEVEDVFVPGGRQVGLVFIQSGRCRSPSYLAGCPRRRNSGSLNQRRNDRMDSRAVRRHHVVSWLDRHYSRHAIPDQSFRPGNACARRAA